MSEQFDDGGWFHSIPASEYETGCYGVTLLDWFAGQIAAGDEATLINGATIKDYDATAKYYYERAAAMVRRKRQLERGETE